MGIRLVNFRIKIKLSIVSFNCKGVLHHLKKKSYVLLDINSELTRSLHIPSYLNGVKPKSISKFKIQYKILIQ